MRRFFNWFATKTSTAGGQPTTFVIAVLIIAIWAITGPMFHYSDTWQLIIDTGTTIVTFLMVFLIQNSQNRDGAAKLAKLDELLRVVDKAREQFIGIEHFTDHQIDLVRARSRVTPGKKEKESKKAMTEDTVDRLFKRSDQCSLIFLSTWSRRSASSIARNSSLNAGACSTGHARSNVGPNRLKSRLVSKPTATMRSLIVRSVT